MSPPPPAPLPVDTSEIDGVLTRLDALLERLRSDGSRLGIFAAMYRRVTRAVKAGILRGDFEDDERMSRFDRLFAEHYFRALSAYDPSLAPLVTPSAISPSPAAPPPCWRVALEATQQSRPLALQHLLLGMNAHINFDLGIAVLEVSPGTPLEDLKADFDGINAILQSLVDDVQRQLGEISPWLGLIDVLAGRFDETLTEFSLTLARDGAWRFAQRLHSAPEGARPALLHARAERIAELGHEIARPGFPLNVAVWAIRLLETNDVRRAIDVLSA